MSCLGVHFSLSPDEAQRLLSITKESARVDYLHEVIEEKCFANQPERMAENDKAWDAMHRALADGTLSWDGGECLSESVELGGRQV